MLVQDHNGIKVLKKQHFMREAGYFPAFASLVCGGEYVNISKN
ncbi:MAG: hypothetical protein ABN478_14715 [Mixta sp.]